MSIVKIMDRGLLVIPKIIREKAAVTKGSYVKIVYRDGEIIVKPLVEDLENNTSKKRNLIIRKAKYPKKDGLKILS